MLQRFCAQLRYNPTGKIEFEEAKITSTINRRTLIMDSNNLGAGESPAARLAAMNFDEEAVAKAGYGRIVEDKIKLCWDGSKLLQNSDNSGTFVQIPTAGTELIFHPRVLGLTASYKLKGGVDFFLNS
jgi:hypothetical protein